MTRNAIENEIVEVGAGASTIQWVLSRRLNVEEEVLGNASDALQEAILRRPRVEEALRKLQQRDGLPRARVDAYARSLLRGLMARPALGSMRTLGLISTLLLKKMYNGLFVNSNGIEVIRKACSSGHSVLLLPTHRSHVDYIVLSFMMAAFDLPLPFVIAGDNLRVSIVGDLLQQAGAVFIRRVFGDDDLYKILFSEYVGALLKRNVVLECFVEGGRSRSGKSLPPKTGFLNVVVEHVASGDIQDVIIVPISIVYDRMVEANAFVNEMLGAQKEKETLQGLVQALRKVTRLHFGSIQVRVSNNTISLRDYLFNDNRKYSIGQDSQRLLLHLAHSVLHECNQVSTITATSLVATVLLTTRGRGIHFDVLCEHVDWLRDELAARNAHVSNSIEDTTALTLVDGALSVLGKLVRRRHKIVFGYHNAEVLELAMYRNQLIHWFVAESLISCAMFAAHSRMLQEQISNAATQDDTEPSIVDLAVDRLVLLDDVQFVSRLLKSEFIYSPSQSIADSFDQTLAFMQRRGTLEMDYNQRIRMPSIALRTNLFLAMLIWPSVDAYWSFIDAIGRIEHKVMMEEDALVLMASSYAEDLYYANQIETLEAASVETLKRALIWLIQQGIVIRCAVDPKTKLKLVQRAEDLKSNTLNLNRLANRINQFRMPPDIQTLYRHSNIDAKL